MKMLLIKRDTSGVSILELLIYIVIASALAMTSWIALSGLRGSTDNFIVKDNLDKSVKITKTYWVNGAKTLPDEESLAGSLNGDAGAITYIAYDGSNPSTKSSEVTVTKENDSQATFCSKSALSGNVYCFRVNYDGMLAIASNTGNHSEGNSSLLAKINPLSTEKAFAASNSTPWESKCMGTVEADTRECLSNATTVAHSNGGSNPGWNSAGENNETGDPVEPPGGEPEPEAPRDYEQVMSDTGSGRSANCDLDWNTPKNANDYRYYAVPCGPNLTLEMQSQGQYNAPPAQQDFATGQPGGILTTPDNKAISFKGTQHYSYGNPSNGATNNQGANWSASVWVKPSVSSSNQALISADDNWALKMSGAQGFGCSMRIGNPWSVTNLTGGNPAQAGQWYFVACTYESGALRLYVNGVLVNGTTGVQVGQSGNGNVRPGYVANSWTSGGYLNGTLDEFNFYKRTLTAQDIADQYYAAGY